MFREKYDCTNKAEDSISEEHIVVQNENLYSNIPQPTTTKLDKRNIENDANTDSSIHLYSNISDTATTIENVSTLKGGNLKDTTISNDTVSGTNHVPVPYDGGFSNLLNDDLDLDEPVIVASNFGQPTAKLNTKPIFFNSNKCDNLSPMPYSKDIQMGLSNLLPTDRMKMNDSAEAAISDNGLLKVDTATNTTNENKKGTSVYDSPRRMRLLQNTTMIDTALDLDSLDGSSLGNNSQACLIKTATV